MKLLVLTVLCLLGAANAQIRWSPATNGHVPPGAIRAGNYQGIQVFVCRASISTDTVPGMLDSLRGACFFAHGSREQRATSYEAPIGQHGWRPFSAGQTIPRDALFGGFSGNRIPNFVCRANHFSSQIPGRLVNGVCWIAASGAEVRYNNSDVLVDPTI